MRLPAARASGPDHPLDELRAGWTEFTARRWVWVIVVAFRILNAVSAGRWLVLGPVVAKATAGFGERGWVSRSAWSP